MGEPVTGRPVGQLGLAEVAGVGLGDRTGLDRGGRRPELGDLLDDPDQVVVGLVRPPHGVETSDRGDHVGQHRGGAGLGVEVRDRHGYIESEPTDSQTGYPQQYRAFFSEKNMRISRPLILHRQTRTRRRRPGNKTGDSLSSSQGPQPPTAVTVPTFRSRVVSRRSQSSLLNHRRKARSSATEPGSLLNHRGQRTLLNHDARLSWPSSSPPSWRWSSSRSSWRRSSSPASRRSTHHARSWPRRPSAGGRPAGRRPRRRTWWRWGSS